MEITIKVRRFKKSYDYKIDDSKNSYSNNIKNNSIDSIYLLKGQRIVYHYNKIQTISNHPNMKHSDTIAPGPFKIKCFVDLRAFEDTGIHGIFDTKDISGQYIDENSMQWDNGQYIGRFLIHSSKYKGKDLNNCYSGACFVFLESKELEKFNNIIKSLGFGPGNIINGFLQEV
jgi:hypothetical protein